jgi:TolB-like protein/cytochrome c-type biogenesis protein CcmH/NrfG
METGAIISFDDFQIDTARGELRRGGEVVPLEPQVLDLIVYVASHPGVIITRDDLIEHVWGGRIVSDSAISTRINAARSALGDDGTAQRIIKTVPRRGFRFEASVGSAFPGAPGRSDKPSIAVLPFENMSGDPEQAYFSDGITDDIITELSRYAELFVIARHSSFAYRDNATPAAEIAADLGVQYIVEGSVRRAGSRVRVTAKLIDPAQGNQIWAERYDRELVDIFTVQDEITTMIVNTLAGQIAQQHYKRVVAESGAYDHVLKATEHALRIDPNDTQIARAEAHKALELDPQFARAHAILALSYIAEGNNFWTGDPAASLRNAYDASRNAVAIDPRDPWAHAMHGIAELWHNRAHDRAIAAMRNSVELNPSNAQFHGLNAYVLAFCAEPEAALAEIDLARAMNPIFPPVFLGFRGRALFMLRRIDEALPVLEQMVIQMPGHSNALAYVAAAYAAKGRTDEARQAIASLHETNPFYTLAAARRYLPFADPKDLAFLVDLFASAGLRE